MSRKILAFAYLRLEGVLTGYKAGTKAMQLPDLVNLMVTCWDTLFCLHHLAREILR